VANIEVFIDGPTGTRRVGLLRRHPARGRETVTFEYAPEWLNARDRFAIDPELPLHPGPLAPGDNKPLFGVMSDSTPDNWGRNLMRRRERRQAETEGRDVRTLQEIDFLLGVSDPARLGALRYCREDDAEFQAPQETGFPDMFALQRLLAIAGRIEEGVETDEDLQFIFAPGSSLGGARPKAGVVDANGQLWLAKFPRQGDEYPQERWEAVALTLAHQAGISVTDHRLEDVAGKPVLLARRFDRREGQRIPYASAMALTQHQDGETGSYLDIADVLIENGANSQADRQELFRRIAFHVLINNVDDHLRNHGFVRTDGTGWSLSPAFDLNPVPRDVKPPVLNTAINFDDPTCSVELLRSVAEEFSLAHGQATAIIREVAETTRHWREIARHYGAGEPEIRRMASAFEHELLEQALAL